MNSAISPPRRALDRVWRSRFARNVAVVASGTAGAHAITMAFAPLITRLYGPEAFGLLGTFMAMVAVAIPVAALAYPIAIVLPREDRDALGLVRLSIILSFGVALLAVGLLAFGGDWLTATLGAESVAAYLFLIPVAMLFAAWMQIAQQWLIRKKQFGAVARSAVAHSLILNSAKTGIGWVHPVGAVLIVLGTLGHALHAALLFIGARRRYQEEARQVVDGPHTPLRELAHRYRDFPLYRAPQNFINAASQSLPVLMLAAFFGPAAAGFYTLAKMAMGMPTALIGKAVIDVFYPRITEASHNGENLPRILLMAIGALLMIGALPFGLVMLFGPWLFSLMFGEDWGVAGEYARWLSAWFLLGLVNRPVVASVPVLGVQAQFLLYEVVSVTFRVAVILVGAYLIQDDVATVMLFSLAGVMLNTVLLVYVLRVAIYQERMRKA